MRGWRGCSSAISPREPTAPIGHYAPAVLSAESAKWARRPTFAPSLRSNVRGETVLTRRLSALMTSMRKPCQLSVSPGAAVRSSASVTRPSIVVTSDSASRAIPRRRDLAHDDRATPHEHRVLAFAGLNPLVLVCHSDKVIRNDFFRPINVAGVFHVNTHAHLLVVDV